MFVVFHSSEYKILVLTVVGSVVTLIFPCVGYCRSGELHVIEDHNVSPWKRVGDHCSCRSIFYCVLLIHSGAIRLGLGRAVRHWPF